MAKGHKSRQLWLWRAIDHETGEVIAYWFGTRKKEPFVFKDLVRRISKKRDTFFKE